MTETAKRYVITNPAFDFGLLPTDQVSFGSDFSYERFEKCPATKHKSLFHQHKLINFCDEHAEIADPGLCRISSLKLS